jgi:hypothetical protein
MNLRMIRNSIIFYFYSFVYIFAQIVIENNSIIKFYV